MLVAGPQRGLFLACLFVGAASALSLDLHFAPRALSAESVSDAGVEAPARAPAAHDGGGAPAPRVVIPAPARVPTIVARFESASKEPLDEAAVRALATAMIEDYDVTIVLEGHSDTRGGDDYNHTISLERAEWVKSRLVALGVSAERIEAVGFGATRPLRSDDPDAPSVNRRVE
ncbi:MAG: OmpA family protein, partial [Labilithrix sp.]|nr:OmpA family protein [Labilithrix sp.]